jgi:cobalt transporter subunit CbtB
MERHQSPSTGLAQTATLSASRSASLQALLAMLLGVVIIGLAGFSHMDAVHNASHDTRHSTAFPCH